MPTQVNIDMPFVAGPASAVLNDVAVYGDTSGKVIKDGAQTIAQIIAAATGAVITVPTFDAAIYTGSGTLVWTVAAGDVNNFRYSKNGKIWTLWLSLTTTTISGTGNNLKVTLPEGAVCARTQSFPVLLSLAGTLVAGICASTLGAAFIAFLKLDFSNFAPGTDNQGVECQIMLEVQ